MDLLDRLLDHDADTTRQLLLLSRDLSDAQLDRSFDIGHETLRRTFVHIIRNMEVWTDLLYERAVRPRPEPPSVAESIADLRACLDAVAPEFAALARRVRDEGRYDALWTDVLDDPPQRKSYGGAIAHLITHSMQHRSEALHILTRLGVPDLPEGDALSWESGGSRLPPMAS
ncbi:MAG: DinB family protein [Thermomicrobia bacterium]|nr:DinB family protein [Thermomicrobia bacterium]